MSINILYELLLNVVYAKTIIYLFVIIYILPNNCLRVINYYNNVSIVHTITIY